MNQDKSIKLLVDRCQNSVTVSKRCGPASGVAKKERRWPLHHLQFRSLLADRVASFRLQRSFGINLLAAVGLSVFLGCQGEEATVQKAPDAQPVVAPAEAIRHRVSFADRAQHYMNVEATFPSPTAELELMMAVWTPGSYKVREYSRHIEDLSATTLDGQSVAVRKTAKNRWIVEASQADQIVVRYRVYGREMTVRTNFVDADFAILNGASTFLTPVGKSAEPHQVELDLPEDWKQSATGLPRLGENGEHRYLAADFDTLVDSPIVAGTLEVRSFEVEGVPHELVHFGDLLRWDVERSAADVESLVREQIAFWGSIPYQRYVFLNGVVDTGGGLEHKNSTLMFAHRFRTETREEYIGWLGLVSHEFFHTWNVKRLRPQALGPFDYEEENYTESLWVAEGLTSYYGPLLLHRAGLIDAEELLEEISSAVGRLQETPGRLVRSLAESSFDAWIKQYLPDENSRNTSISYYTKGQVVGWLMDAEIRGRTRGKSSLDDVMRALYSQYSGDRGFAPEEFTQVVKEVTGEDFSGHLEDWVESASELDYQGPLKEYGLSFKSSEGQDEESEIPGWLGFESRQKEGRMIITRVPRETPAYEYGLNVGDEVLAIDDSRLSREGWGEMLSFFPPSRKATLLITRRGQVRELAVTMGEEPEAAWELEIDGKSTSLQKSRREAWMTGN